MDAFYQALNDFGYTHPVHPTMVYLPIGGVMAAFIFGIIIGYFGGEIVFGGLGAPQSVSAVEANTTDPQSQKSITFNEVSEIFEQHCNMCHAGSSAPHGLQLDSYAQVMAGGEHGEVIVPGKPNESKLILRIEGKSKPAMPFRQPALAENIIQTLVRWVEEGAPKGDDASR